MTSRSTIVEQKTDAARLTDGVRETARQVGFDLVGIAPAISPTSLDAFHDWLNRGYAGEMHYFARRQAAYDHPSGVLRTVRSIIVVGLNYAAKDKDDGDSEATPVGRIAKYAQGSRDYHQVIKDRLQRLADFLHSASPGCRTRPVVDTAPLLERDFARLAGLGWFGKNTMLLNKRLGSWFFLGALLTDLELEPDSPHETAHCGTCTRCLDACPTQAFTGPYVLDARRCISYLTIELRDEPIPTELRPLMGDWVFGCDVCQDVCPWNRKAPGTTIPEFQPLPELQCAELESLLKLTDAEFEQRFGPTPLERPRRAGLVRNAAIAAGNYRDRRLVPILIHLLNDNEPLIRGAAAWALGQIGGEAGRKALQSQGALEHQPSVIAELNKLTSSEVSPLAISRNTLASG